MLCRPTFSRRKTFSARLDEHYGTKVSLYTYPKIAADDGTQAWKFMLLEEQQLVQERRIKTTRDFGTSLHLAQQASPSSPANNARFVTSSGC